VKSYFLAETETRFNAAYMAWEAMARDTFGVSASDTNFDTRAGRGEAGSALPVSGGCMWCSFCGVAKGACSVAFGILSRRTGWRLSPIT